MLTSGIHMPTRRSLDWISMKIKNVDKKRDNYIKSGHFIFNKFKTAKFVKDEDKKIKIPLPIKKVIKTWLEQNKNDYLICQKNGKPFTSSSFTKRLNKIYGMNVGVDLLRSTYLTNKFVNIAEKVEEMNKITKEMGSSTNSALNYYIKDQTKK